MAPNKMCSDLTILQSMVLAKHHDVIFVSIDVEGGRRKKESDFRIYEIGFSMLDTRQILEKDLPLEHAITTRHFVVGGHRRQTKAAKENIFGMSEAVEANNLPAIIRETLSIKDTKTSSSPLVKEAKLRNIVVVGHSFHGDCKLLREAGVDMNISTLPMVIKIVDTLVIARSVLGKGGSVESLLKAFRIPYMNLHSAANDANLTLKALLMLIHRSLRQFPSPELHGTVFKTQESRKLAWLQAVARQELPDVEARNESWRDLKAEGMGIDILGGNGVLDFDCMFESIIAITVEDLV